MRSVKQVLAEALANHDKLESVIVVGFHKDKAPISDTQESATSEVRACASSRDMVLAASCLLRTVGDFPELSTEKGKPVLAIMRRMASMLEQMAGAGTPTENLLALETEPGEAREH